AIHLPPVEAGRILVDFVKAKMPHPKRYGKKRMRSAFHVIFPISSRTFRLKTYFWRQDTVIAYHEL
ncbi:hypothetical protein, partial [Hungatella effluvii]|uniref:hypothetical protein n=1 Tax=Hungatella effluvii TaxID=1096246 RepID=UPI002A7F05A9